MNIIVTGTAKEHSRAYRVAHHCFTTATKQNYEWATKQKTRDFSTKPMYNKMGADVSKKRQESNDSSHHHLEPCPVEKNKDDKPNVELIRDKIFFRYVYTILFTVVIIIMTIVSDKAKEYLSP